MRISGFRVGNVEVTLEGNGSETVGDVLRREKIEIADNTIICDGEALTPGQIDTTQASSVSEAVVAKAAKGGVA